jgi:hypothetical protein
MTIRRKIVRTAVVFIAQTVVTKLVYRIMKDPTVRKRRMR